MHKLPPHLQKYIVSQNYEKYTPIDQACWRYILRQLQAYLSKHAHECYLEGLEKTGISVERIPRISEISKHLEKFGWRALPVSGFIPPAAFMELQSYGVLPIASDMRTIEHLSYTPAPDIVHEAAGHAPILIHPEFSAYLKKYAEVANKAIISKEDLDLYEAIRILSDLKENPASTTSEIEAAQANLEKISKSMSHVSEATELSRMNWWTAEYGLIGSLENPKIFGAGLLSSVGESKWCLSEKVRKIPLSVACIKQGYDITEPQPQLFVAKDFAQLSEVLDEMAQQMAFRKGGKDGLEKAILAQTITTCELDSGLQISGLLSEALIDKQNNVFYIKLSGRSQISYQNKQLPQHDSNYHSHGYSTALGEYTCSKGAIESIPLQQHIDLHYQSGIKVSGKLVNKELVGGKIRILSFVDCTVSLGSKILFDPSWGTYDLCLGSYVTSVFGGAADRVAFGASEDFPALRVAQPIYSPEEKTLHKFYGRVRELREAKADVTMHMSELMEMISNLEENYPSDWLLTLEIYELSRTSLNLRKLVERSLERLRQIELSTPNLKDAIQNGVEISTLA